MARKRNVGLEIGISLGGGALVAIGLGIYLNQTMPSREELEKNNGLVHDAPSAGSAKTIDDLALARAVVEGFGADLAAKRYEAAYARMAAPYRDTFSLEAFRASCEQSRFLTSAQRAGVLRTTRMALGPMPGDAGTLLSTPSTIKGQGVVVTAVGSIDATFTLLADRRGASILVLALAGIPVLDGVSGAPAR